MRVPPSLTLRVCSDEPQNPKLAHRTRISPKLDPAVDDEALPALSALRSDNHGPVRVRRGTTPAAQRLPFKPHLSLSLVRVSLARLEDVDVVLDRVPPAKRRGFGVSEGENGHFRGVGLRGLVVDRCGSLGRGYRVECKKQRDGVRAPMRSLPITLSLPPPSLPHPLTLSLSPSIPPSLPLSFHLFVCVCACLCVCLRVCSCSAPRGRRRRIRTRLSSHRRRRACPGRYSKMLPAGH